MLNKKDNETLQEVLIAFHAKNKLDEIKKYLQDHKGDSISKKEIMVLIEKEDTQNDCISDSYNCDTPELKG